MSAQVAETIHDQILRRALDVESYGAAVAREDLIPALTWAMNELSKRLLAQRGTTFALTRYQRIQGEIAGVLKALGDKYAGVIDEARLEIIRTEYDQFTRLIRDEAGKDVSEAAYKLPVAQAKAMLTEPMGGAFLNDWIDSHLSGIKGRLRRELTQSLILGETNAEAARRLRDSLGLSRNGADLLARTAVAQAAAVAHDAVLEKHKNLISGYKVVATLDARTCPACANYDGLTSRNRADLPSFPIHPRCRCQVVPVTEFEDDSDTTRAAVFEQEGRTIHHTKVENGKRVPDGTTSTKWEIKKAGQVSAQKTFRDFFDRQPEGWKRRYLGTARYDLYKAGKISFEDLASNNQVLTLAELRAGL